VSVARSLHVSSAVKFYNQVVTIASAALDVFKNEAKKMVVALVDMERAFVPPQHFIRLVQRRYAQ
jgi:dynamin GTPase